MEAIQSDAAGIDLGSREHWVAGPPQEDGTPNVKRFGTTTPELYHLADWLKEQGVKTVAMESTGVYWIAIFEILDSRGLEVLLVNARQLTHVPGRKPTCSTANGFNSSMLADYCAALFGHPTIYAGCAS